MQKQNEIAFVERQIQTLHHVKIVHQSLKKINLDKEQKNQVDQTKSKIEMAKERAGPDEIPKHIITGAYLGGARCHASPLGRQYSIISIK